MLVYAHYNCRGPPFTGCYTHTFVAPPLLISVQWSTGRNGQRDAAYGLTYMRETPCTRAEGELKEKSVFTCDQCNKAGRCCCASMNGDADAVSYAACWRHAVLFTLQSGHTVVTVKSIQSYRHSSYTLLSCWDLSLLDAGMPASPLITALLGKFNTQLWPPILCWSGQFVCVCACVCVLH